MTKISPVAVFGYNRPDHLEQTLNSLMKNELADKTPLYIFLDGAKNNTDISQVAAVLDVAQAVTGFASLNIITHDKNVGLATSIINGVSEILKEYESIIVLEDDLVTSQYFLSYMNTALERYQDVEQVMSISAFGRKEIINNLNADEPYDAYFVPRNSSWGWGTWKNSWLLADWEVNSYEDFKNDTSQRKKFSESGNDLCLMLDLQLHGFLDSWAIRWIYTHFSNDGVSLVPYYSYVHNIGFDGSGTHCRSSHRFELDLSKAKRVPVLPDSVYVREDTLAAFYLAHKQRFVSRLYWRVKLLGRQLGLL